jgi:hypothetical protein
MAGLRRARLACGGPPTTPKADVPVATDHSDQLREYRAKLNDVKEYL